MVSVSNMLASIQVLYRQCGVSGDLYVHADLHGASSVVLKNPTGRFETVMHH